jgi:hypothetical protein
MSCCLLFFMLSFSFFYRFMKPANRIAGNIGSNNPVPSASSGYNFNSSHYSSNSMGSNLPGKSNQLPSIGGGNSNSIGGSMGGVGGYKASSLLPSLGGGGGSGLGNVSASSSAGSNNYLPPTGAAAGSRFGRLAQFGVMSGAGSNQNNSIVSGNNNNHQGQQDYNNIGSSFTSGFGRHKI